MDSTNDWNPSANQMDLEVEKDKQRIKSHPMFPLVELLFHECEQQTSCTSRDAGRMRFRLDEEVVNFGRRLEVEQIPLFINDNELDTLMIKAVQVLRIHLLELEKVDDLCKDFCKRYISCLKGKMQSENLLRTSETMDRAGDDLPPAFPPDLNNGMASSLSSVQQNGFRNLDTPHVSIGHSLNPYDYAGTRNANPSVLQNLSATAQQQIGLYDFGETDPNRIKRGLLPRAATETLRSWLFQHLVHPYPTEDEKRTLAQQTGLTLLQVNNWFINARRRILQPMMENDNRKRNRSWPHEGTNGETKENGKSSESDKE